MKLSRLPVLACLCACVSVDAIALPSCLPGHAVPIVVSLGADARPKLALLRGGASPRISLVERETGRVLWTASDVPPATQQFAAMHAGFAGSFTVIDLDGDGVHDRLYAGDLAGRLWRFDLHQAVAPQDWASGGIWADFSTAAGRGFLAPPDVSLSALPGQMPRLNIAAGTARTTDSAVANRFYVLRDQQPFEVWSDADYRKWQPLRETDLLAIGKPGDEAAAAIDHGYYFDLGTADVMAPSLTVSGRATLALSIAAPDGNCQVAVTTASFDIDTAAPSITHSTPSGNEQAGSGPVVLPAGSGLELKLNDAGQALCMLGNTHVAACDVDTTPVQIYWRREDAD